MELRDYYSNDSNQFYVNTLFKESKICFRLMHTILFQSGLPQRNKNMEQERYGIRSITTCLHFLLSTLLLFHTHIPPRSRVRSVKVICHMMTCFHSLALLSQKLPWNNYNVLPSHSSIKLNLEYELFNNYFLTLLVFIIQ